MAAVSDAVAPAAADNGDRAAAALHTQRAISALHRTFFLSVAQSVVLIQSEPILVQAMCDDDMARTMFLLGESLLLGQ